MCGDREYMETLLSVQCCCEAKTSLKKKAYNYYVSMLDVYVYK